MIESREDIRILINRIEEDYPVCKWKHNDYHIWPVLRIALYMHLVKKNENSNTEEKTGKKKYSRLYQILQILISVKDFVLLDKDIETVYLGAPSHCVNYDGKRFNRYFDPLMDENNFPSLYLDKSSINKSGAYKPERQLLYGNLLKGLTLVKRFFKKDCEGWKYIDKLSNIVREYGVDIEGFEKRASNYVRSVNVSYELALKLLKKIEPEKLWVLCYYSPSVMGLLIAAHKLSIPTIDMQHGGQGENHLAYSSWHNVPDEGYEALPNFFYTWDKSSAEIINTWARKTEKHSAVMFGNPWVQGWKNGEFDNTGYEWPDNLILYTLQPSGNPLETHLLEVIKKTKDKYNWWVRLHPRQMDQVEDIRSKLRTHNLLEFVNIDDASNLYLPEILSHTKVHLTKFSGCAIEAFQFGIPTIILDKKGTSIFEQYIKSGDLMVSYVDKDSNGLINCISETGKIINN